MEESRAMSLSPPALGGGATTLRPLHASDADAIVEQCRDELTQKWTSIAGDYSMEDAHRWIRHLVPAGWESGRECTFAVNHEGSFAGSVGLRSISDGTAEISYGLHPEFRGHGISQAALRLLLDWGFAELDLHTIRWLALAGNWASRKVAWGLGFSFDGTLRGWLPLNGEHRDAWAGSLLRGDALHPRGEWFDVPTIEGDLVRLRRVRREDRERILSGANDPLNQEWIRKLQAPFTALETDSYLDDYEEGMATGTAVHWAMADPNTDDFLGTMSVLRIARPNGEIGYWAHPEARGRGVVTEATQLAIGHAFNVLKLERLCLYAATANLASRAVAERSGFRRIGTERRTAHREGAGLVDCDVYDLLPEDLM